MSIVRRVALLLVIVLLIKVSRMAILGRAPEKEEREFVHNPGPDRVPPDDPAPASKYLVSEHGIGPIEIGMRTDSVARLLGEYFRASYGAVHQQGFGCDWAVWPTGPAGIHVILESDHVVGVLVDTGMVETDRHVQIGMRVDLLPSMYSILEPNIIPDYAHGRAADWTVQYHPDPDRHDLMLIYEVRDSVVRSFRAGKNQSISEPRGC
jgi:hypothetical protein